MKSPAVQIVLCLSLLSGTVAMSSVEGLEPGRFRRGDANLDSQVNIADPLAILSRLFSAMRVPSCPDALDVDDSGTIDVRDPVWLLRWLLVGGSEPSAPGPFHCGVDPSPDFLLECRSSGPECATESSSDLQNREFDMRSDAPTAAGTDRSEGIVVSALAPREVESRDAPVLYTVTGDGFRPDDRVRVFYPTERDLVKEIIPRKVSADQILFKADLVWFQGLDRWTGKEPTRPGADAGAPGFYVKVIGQDGGVSKTLFAGIKRFPLRLANAWIGEDLLIAPVDQLLGIELEWRSWNEPVEVSAMAFAAPPEEEITVPTRYVLAHIPGIEVASATLQSSDDLVSLPVAVSGDVKPGHYRLQVQVKAIGGPLAGATLAARAVKVHVARPDDGIREGKGPNDPPVEVVERKALQSPNTQPAPPPYDRWDLPGPPMTHIDLHYAGPINYGGGSLYRFKYPKRATGYAIETRRRPTDDWHVYEIIDPSVYTEGWIDYPWLGVLQENCYLSVRIRAWNYYAELICWSNGATKEVTQGFIPRNKVHWVQLTDVSDDHLKFKFWAEVWGAAPDFQVTVIANSNWVLSYTYENPPLGVGEYNLTVPWSEAINGPYLGATHCLTVGVSNECGGGGSSPEVCFTYQGANTSIPGGNNNNPPPPLPKPDLGFVSGIWVDWDSGNGPQTWPAPGQPLEVTWTFGNFGGQSTGGFSDNFIVDGVPWLDPWPSFAPNDVFQAVVEYPWGFSAGSHMLEEYLDWYNQVNEITNLNNYHSYGLQVGW